MKTSKRGIDLIKSFESLALKAYRCPAGVLTIGWGHTAGVHEGDECTEKEACEYLMDDLKAAEAAVCSIHADLSQEQFDALVSFVFNVGAGAFRSSTLRRKVEENQYDPSIKHEFARWNKSNGKVLPGLVRRRQAEADMYFKCEL